MALSICITRGYANCCICSVGSQCRTGYILLGLALIIGALVLAGLYKNRIFDRTWRTNFRNANCSTWALSAWFWLVIANPTIQLLAEIGGILLLFKIGLSQTLKN